MKYEVQKNKIIINDTTEFNPTHILECGQIFRYKKLNETDYIMFSGDKFAVIAKQNNCYEISTKNVSYFEHFFDLKTDYDKIKSQLAFSNIMQNAINFGYGIRILNQQPLEMIISFIISANNNIKRIQSLVEKLCAKCGTNMGEYFAFPTLNQLKTLTEQDLRQMGLGFRAKYIYNTVRAIEKVDLQNLALLSTPQLLEFLISLSGIGPKVADCIALFGYHKMDCFPVDTWIEKVYKTFFGGDAEKISRKQIRQKLTHIFGNQSGYAQQYLFYYKREMDRNS